jgi:hypothetical protein
MDNLARPPYSPPVAGISSILVARRFRPATSPAGVPIRLAKPTDPTRDLTGQPTEVTEAVEPVQPDRYHTLSCCVTVTPKDAALVHEMQRFIRGRWDVGAQEAVRIRDEHKGRERNSLALPCLVLC